MCRRYGDTVRLCYRHGEHKGERLSVEAAQALGWPGRGCVPGAKRRYLRRQPKGMYNFLNL
jgi:hypothetical protein